MRARTYALIAVDVVIAGDDEQSSFFEIRGFEEVVEELSGEFVFPGLAGVGDVAGGEDDVRGA